MKLKKALKLSFGVLVAFPLSFFVGNDILANHLKGNFEYELSNETLLACGGGGGSMSPTVKKAQKAKKAKAKLLFKKKQLSKMAAKGESTTKLEAEIAELEALLAK